MKVVVLKLHLTTLLETQERLTFKFFVKVSSLPFAPQLYSGKLATVLKYIEGCNQYIYVYIYMMK